MRSLTPEGEGQPCLRENQVAEYGRKVWIHSQHQKKRNHARICWRVQNIAGSSRRTP